jgi:hypothetical protein
VTRARAAMARVAGLALAAWGCAGAGVALGQAEPPPAGSVMVDRIVAVVGTTPIAASEVEFEAQLGDRIAGEGCAASFGRLLCEERAPLERLIFRQTLQQAGLAADIQVSVATIEQAERAFAERFETKTEKDEFFAAWGLDDAAFRELLLVVARLDQAIDVTVGRLVRDVSEEEERRYHAENRDLIFGGRPYEEVASLVSRRYYAFKFERTYGSWASELRASGRIRYVGR